MRSQAEEQTARSTHQGMLGDTVRVNLHKHFEQSMVSNGDALSLQVGADWAYSLVNSYKPGTTVCRHALTF